MYDDRELLKWGMYDMAANNNSSGLGSVVLLSLKLAVSDLTSLASRAALSLRSHLAHSYHRQSWAGVLERLGTTCQLGAIQPLLCALLLIVTPGLVRSRALVGLSEVTTKSLRE